MGTKIVLDTNVIISDFGWKGSPHRILKRCIKGDLRLFTSPLLIAELSKVLSYKKFSFHQDEIDEFISITLETAELVEPNFKLSLITEDPSDNRILECALAGNCDYIITGDKHLIKIKQLDNVSIVAPDKFLKLITRKGPIT